jgi:hypothetical protein
MTLLEIKVLGSSKSFKEKPSPRFSKLSSSDFACFEQFVFFWELFIEGIALHVHMHIGVKIRTHYFLLSFFIIYLRIALS